MLIFRAMFLAACLVVGSCGPISNGSAKPNPTPAASQQTAKPSSPSQSEEGEVTASCGGGVTGGGGGITLRSDHHVISWQKVTANAARTETDLGADDTLFANTHRSLQTAGFANINYDQPADMTCSLAVGGHYVSWQPGDPNAPASVLAIHHLLMSARR